MTEATYPFHSLSFTLVEGASARAALRMTRRDDEMYDLHVERGSAVGPTSQFTRVVPAKTAQSLSDALQRLGVYGWDESYPDARDAVTKRWVLNVVFREGLFSLSSRGGSAVPAGFEQMLEEFYRIDFPRPDVMHVGTSGRAGTAGGAGALGGAPGGALGGLGNLGDLGSLGSLGDLSGIDADELSNIASEMQRNPQAFEQRMKDEFAHMSRDEQEQLLDMLASTGFASRAWWERFLRGF